MRKIARFGLAVVLTLLLAGPARADFVINNTSLVTNKQDLFPTPIGANPLNYITAADYNAVAQAAIDIRSHMPQLLVATFTAADNVALTWTNNGGTQYVAVGVPIVTDGGGGVVFHLTNKTSTGATLNASAPWTGTVAVLVISQ